MGVQASKTSQNIPQAETKGSSPGQARQLKRGEILFKEGETSRAMFYLKKGMIRIFKNKGSSSRIEIDTVRSGQLLGELAFLDGQARSASGEALTECELVEISERTFAQTMTKMPDWVKLLLRTVVGRLRTANTRIRQLESASTAFDYSQGGKTSNYIYISPKDTLKILSSILLAVAYHGKKDDDGAYLKTETIQQYGQHIIGIPFSKITDLLEILVHIGSIKPADSEMKEIWVQDTDLLKRFVHYYNEQTLLEESKQQKLSMKGFIIMSLIAKKLPELQADSDGYVSVNIAQIKKETEETSGKEIFRLDEFAELHNQGLASQLQMKSDECAEAQIEKKAFLQLFSYQKIIQAVQALNKKKSK